VSSDIAAVIAQNFTEGERAGTRRLRRSIISGRFSQP
jgi:hypothetical protein